MRRFFISSALVFGILLFAQPVAAAVVDPFDVCKQNEDNLTDSSICAAKQGEGGLFGPNSLWNNILNTVTFVIGAVAVLMIIIGAMRYALSAGDQAQVTTAKNTILYAVIALIIAVMANAIVNFVLTNI
ncbi:MAG TPA: pilin [Candidatus Saccharimonadales bacterium]|nr:pilin [Candidatus Saccharimonadales bacterium]